MEYNVVNEEKSKVCGGMISEVYLSYHSFKIHQFYNRRKTTICLISMPPAAERRVDSKWRLFFSVVATVLRHSLI